jgi:hypothetical protein
MGKIRFLKTTTNYPNYMDAFVLNNPEILSMNYEAALKFYFSDCNSWADYWKINLEATGNFICAEVIENASFLQMKWASERGLKFNENQWREEILLEQIKDFRPDVLFLVDQYGDNSLSKKIKQLVPSIKLLLGWDGILWHKPETYENTDIILTCVPETADFYRAHGKKSYYHKFGFETSVLERLTRKKKQDDVVFAGSLILNENYHMNRLKLIAELSRKTNLTIHASSLPKNWSLFHRYRLMNTIRNKNYQFALDLQRVGFKNKGEVFGLKMFNALYNSKIVFNTHGDNSIKTAANMRMTEATGVGSLLLTDWKENLHELFIPDEEIVTYKSAAEAIDKIRMLLNDDKLRTKIATNGQNRTLREYSYRARMLEFEKFLTPLLE